MEAAEAMAMPPGLSWEEAASIPLTFLVCVRHAGAAGPAEGRRMAADQRRVVRRGRGLAAAGQGAGREGHRHLGVGRQAGGAQAARPRRRAVHPRRRLRARGDGGNRRSTAPTWSSTRSAAPYSRRTSARWPSKAGSRRWAMSMACCTPTSTSRPCTPSGSPCSASPTSCARKEQRAAAVPRFVAEVMPHFARGTHPAADRPGDRLRAAGRGQGAHGSRRAMSERSCCACPSRPDVLEIRTGDKP